MKKLIFFFSLLTQVVFGQPYADTIQITTADLPYTIPNNFTAYRITGPGSGPTPYQINSATNGIIVSNKHDIEIFGEYLGVGSGRASLNFVSGGGDGRYGFALSNCYNVIVKNLRIVAGDHLLDDDLDSGNVCIRETGSTRNVVFRNCSFNPDGLDSKGFNQIVDAGYNSYNIRFTNSLFHQWSDKFTRRDYYMASLIKCELSKVVEPPDYHIQIDSCLFERSIHVAVAITGSQVPVDSGALVHIFGNEFHQQGTNKRYTTFTDNATQSLGDNFALSYIGLRRGSKIYDNVIYGDVVDSSYGGSGMLVQGAHGWLNDPVEIFNNRMILRSGAHIALSRLKQATQGFYIRSLDNVNSNQNLHVFGNLIDIYVDTAQATTSIGGVAEGIRILCDTMSHGILIVNNHVSINRSDSANGMGNGSGESELITSALTIAKQDNNPHINPIVIFGNYFGSYKSPLRYGSNRESSYGANDTYLQADTFVSYVDRDTTIWFETNGSYVGHSTNNIHQDCVFLGSANPSDIVFAGGSAVDSLGKSVEHWQTIRLYCADLEGDPIAGVSIHYANPFTEGFAGISGYDGWFEQRFKIRYDYQDYLTGDSYNPGDTTFNPFTFTGYTAGSADTAMTILTISHSLFTDTLVFDNSTVAPILPGNRVYLRKKNPATDAAFDGPPNQ